MPPARATARPLPTLARLRPTVALVTLGFTVLTAVALVRHGYVGLFEIGLADTAAAQILFDLVIMASLAFGWVFVDARERGVSPWPYAAVTLTFGSFGPLAYLLLRRAPAAGRVEANT